MGQFLSTLLAGAIALAMLASTIVVSIFTALVGISLFLFKATIGAIFVALIMIWEKLSRK